MDIHRPGKCLVKVSGSGSSIIGCIVIRILGFDDRKLKNIKSFKNAIYLSLGLHKGRPSYRIGLQPSKENI
jgi:hypothetical protein